MTTVTAPVWAPWTSYYDSAGQGPAMVTNVAADGLNVLFGLDRFKLSVQGGQDAPFAGAVGLSGALCLVVVNNDGGGIFSTLEQQAAFPGSFERSSVEARTDRAAGAALRARLRDAAAQAVDRLP